MNYHSNSLEEERLGEDKRVSPERTAGSANSRGFQGNKSFYLPHFSSKTSFASRSSGSLSSSGEEKPQNSVVDPGGRTQRKAQSHEKESHHNYTTPSSNIYMMAPSSQRRVINTTHERVLSPRCSSFDLPTTKKVSPRAANAVLHNSERELEGAFPSFGQADGLPTNSKAALWPNEENNSTKQSVMWRNVGSQKTYYGDEEWLHYRNMNRPFSSEGQQQSCNAPQMSVSTRNNITYVPPSARTTTNASGGFGFEGKRPQGWVQMTGTPSESCHSEEWTENSVTTTTVSNDIPSDSSWQHSTSNGAKFSNHLPSTNPYRLRQPNCPEERAHHHNTNVWIESPAPEIQATNYTPGHYYEQHSGRNFHSTPLRSSYAESSSPLCSRIPPSPNRAHYYYTCHPSNVHNMPRYSPGYGEVPVSDYCQESKALGKAEKNYYIVSSTGSSTSSSSSASASVDNDGCDSTISEHESETIPEFMRQRCNVPGCCRLAKGGIFCLFHNKPKYGESTSSNLLEQKSRSSIVRVTSYSKRRASSGFRTCAHTGCTSLVRSRGHCFRHGGGRRCQFPGCKNGAASNERCKRHGGGKRCTVSDCRSSAESGGLCYAHGGGRRCGSTNCNARARKNGYCNSHAAAAAAK